jgi:hypothetical protein
MSLKKSEKLIQKRIKKHKLIVTPFESYRNNIFFDNIFVKKSHSKKIKNEIIQIIAPYNKTVQDIKKTIEEKTGIIINKYKSSNNYTGKNGNKKICISTCDSWIHQLIYSIHQKDISDERVIEILKNGNCYDDKISFVNENIDKYKIGCTFMGNNYINLLIICDIQNIIPKKIQVICKMINKNYGVKSIFMGDNLSIITKNNINPSSFDICIEMLSPKIITVKKKCSSPNNHILFRNKLLNMKSQNGNGILTKSLLIPNKEAKDKPVLMEINFREKKYITIIEEIINTLLQEDKSLMTSDVAILYPKYFYFDAQFNISGIFCGNIENYRNHYFKVVFILGIDLLPVQDRENIDLHKSILNMSLTCSKKYLFVCIDKRSEIWNLKKDFDKICFVENSTKMKRNVPDIYKSVLKVINEHFGIKNHQERKINKHAKSLLKVKDDIAMNVRFFDLSNFETQIIVFGSNCDLSNGQLQSEKYMMMIGSLCEILLLKYLYPECTFDLLREAFCFFFGKDESTEKHKMEEFLEIFFTGKNWMNDECICNISVLYDGFVNGSKKIEPFDESINCDINILWKNITSFADEYMDKINMSFGKDVSIETGVRKVGIFGKCDAYNPQTKTLFEIKASRSIEYKKPWITQALYYALLLNVHGFETEHIIVVNLLTGNLFLWNLVELPPLEDVIKSEIKNIFGWDDYQMEIMIKEIERKREINKNNQMKESI